MMDTGPDPRGPLASRLLKRTLRDSGKVVGVFCAGLALGVVALWAISWSFIIGAGHTFQPAFRMNHSFLGIESYRGILHFEFKRYWTEPPRPDALPREPGVVVWCDRERGGRGLRMASMDGRRGPPRALTFSYRNDGFDQDSGDGETLRYRSRRVVVPHWFVALGLGLWPVVRLIRWRRRVRRTRRIALGLCPVCGYDLRATPRRCPECGREPNGSAIVV